jgi:O-antigen/teichoic acid export membrane protein
MSLRRNTIANYVGSGYLALIDVIAMPLYLKFLGAEAFGLVGFLVLLRVWLRLLDLGLSPTLARQVAYAKGLGQGFREFGHLLRSFEILFLGIAVAVAVTVYLASDSIAGGWMAAQAISDETVAECVSLMGMIIALSFFSSLYRSGIRGMEDQLWLNIANILISTTRVAGALVLLVFVSTDVLLFFQYQVAMALIGAAVFALRFYSSLSLRPRELPLRIELPVLRDVAPFALSSAYTAAIWVVLSQSDKLILSAILPLQEFGYFTLVIVISGAILIIAAPISQALLPRMTGLLAAGQRDSMLHIYRSASQLVAVIGVSTALPLAFYSEALVYAWTGNRPAAAWCADVLPWFALGNGIMVVSAFQRYLQHAFGNLKLQVIGSTVSAVLQVPIIFYAASRYGAVGAGIAWFAIRSVWFLIWTAVVHGKFVPGFHTSWLRRDLLPVIVPGILMSLLLVNTVEIDLSMSRTAIAASLILVGSAVLSAAAIGSSYIRSSVGEYVSKFRAAA